MPSSHRNYIPRPDDVDVARRYGFHRESAALEDPTIYYPLLSLLTSHLPLFETSSTKEQLSTIYDLVASSDLIQRHPMWDLSSFKTSLAMHEASPKVQAFYQYYDSVVAETELGRGIGGVCESWVEWRGKGFCGVDELKRDMELTLSSNARSVPLLPSPTPSKGTTLILTYPDLSASPGQIPKILPFDHIYPQAYIASPHPPAILYTPNLSSTQADLYEYLMMHAKADETFEVVVRYRPVQSSTKQEDQRDANRRKNSLKGYGVEMVLKRTDYLAVDDRDTGHVESESSRIESGR